MHKRNQKGFTLLEIMVVIAIMACLAAIAIPLNLRYLVKARSVEIIKSYETIRELVVVNYDGDDDCADIVNKINPEYFKNEYVNLDIGFEAIPSGGFVPVFRVCANIIDNQKMGVKVATAAHKAFVNMGVMAKGAVVGESLVTFASPLASPETAICTTFMPPKGDGSACSGASGLKPMPVTQPVASAPDPASAPAPDAPAPLPKPAGPKLPDTTTKGVKCKDWEYAKGANCVLRPEYVSLTITKKPSLADNPCPEGYYFLPSDGQAYSGGSQDGQCVSQGNHQDPYASVRCTVSKPGIPAVLGERVYMDTECHYPDNFCVSILSNKITGARELVRRCGNREEASQEWFYGTSDNDKCTTFDPQFVLTLDFECTWACVEDDCNANTNPMIDHKDAMWKP